MLGENKNHCVCAGYKNCKFEQGYPAHLINSCISISENAE